MSSEVSSGWIPSNIGNTVVLTSAQQLDIRSRLSLLLVRVVISGEVEVPEFDISLGGRSEDAEDNVSTLGRPHDGVGNLAVEMLDRDKVALLRVGRVEVDVELHNDTGDVLAVVGIVG